MKVFLHLVTIFLMYATNLHAQRIDYGRTPHGLLCDDKVMWGRGYKGGKLDSDFEGKNFNEARNILIDKIARLDPRTASLIDIFLNQTESKSIFLPDIYIELPEIDEQLQKRCRDKNITKAYNIINDSRLIFSADAFNRLTGLEQLQLLLEASFILHLDNSRGSTSYATAHFLENFGNARNIGDRYRFLSVYGGQGYVPVNFHPHLYGGLLYFSPTLPEPYGDDHFFDKGRLYKRQEIEIGSLRFVAYGDIAFYENFNVSEIEHDPKELAELYNIVSDRTRFNLNGAIISVHVPTNQEFDLELPTRNYGIVRFTKGLADDLTFYFDENQDVWKICSNEAASNTKVVCKKY